MNKFLLSALTAFVINSYAIAQTDSDSPEKLNEVILTVDSKSELTRKDSGKPVIKITKADIEKQAAASVADLLNQFAGIEINGARSNAGQNLGLFIRGGNNRQVSFLIDGAQINDGSQIASDFDLRLLSLDLIEEIEILKGASSSLYGANASAAVINIKLRKEAKEKFKLSLSSFLGTNTSSEQGTSGIDSFTTGINASGSLGKGFYYGLGFNHQSVDGLSAAEAPDGAPANQSDPFNRVNLDARAGFTDAVWKWNSYIGFDEFKAAFDDFSLIDANNETYSKQLRYGTNVSYAYSDKGSIVYNDVTTITRRDNRSDFPNFSNSEGIAIDLYNKYDVSINEKSALKTIVGFNYRNSKYESFSVPFGETSFVRDIDNETANFSNYDPYINLVYVSSFGFNLNVGARYNIHSEYDSQLVYSVNPSYRFSMGEATTKLYATYGTAYITPSLFQLFDLSFGNDALNPEDNATAEVGIEYSTANSLFSVSAFSREENNLVIFALVDPVNFTFQYQNEQNKLIARGIEVTGQYRLLDNKIILNGNYTFTERENISILTRIPKHKINASATVQVAPRFNVTGRYQYNDPRGDLFFDSNTFASVPVTLKSYQVVDLDLTYGLKDKAVVFYGGVSNIANTDFQELFGFQTRGRNYKVGVRLTL